MAGSEDYGRERERAGAEKGDEGRRMVKVGREEGGFEEGEREVVGEIGEVGEVREEGGGGE